MLMGKDMTGYFIASNFYAQYVTTIKLSFKQPGKYYPPLATDSDMWRLQIRCFIIN